MKENVTFEPMDLTLYKCEQCDAQGVCWSAMDVFGAQLCETCYAILLKEYEEHVRKYCSGSNN